MKYDDASWHSGGQFPEDLPIEAGATHIGMYLTWALLAGLSGSYHIRDVPEGLQRLRRREITPGGFFLKYCDGKFADEDLNEEGNEFTEFYYSMAKEDPLFLVDYSRTLVAGLKSEYHVPDTWENFDKLKPVIDRRFKQWRTTHRTTTNAKSLLELHIGNVVVPIRYWSEGSGPVVLFVHGWMSNSRIWTETFLRLPLRFKLIAIDLPGFGESPPVPKSMRTLDGYASIVEAVVSEISRNDDLKLLVADSFGGLAILRLLRRLAIPAEGLVLSDCPVNGLPWILSWIKLKGLVSLSIRTLRILPNSMRYFLFKVIYRISKTNVLSTGSILQYCLESADAETAEDLIKELFRPLKLDSLGMGDGSKVRIIRGKRDLLSTASDAKQLSESLEGELFEIEGAGHIPMLEKPDVYAETIASFLVTESDDR